MLIVVSLYWKYPSDVQSYNREPGDSFILMDTFLLYLSVQSKWISLF